MWIHFRSISVHGLLLRCLTDVRYDLLGSLLSLVRPLRLVMLMYSSQVTTQRRDTTTAHTPLQSCAFFTSPLTSVEWLNSRSATMLFSLLISLPPAGNLMPILSAPLSLSCLSSDIAWRNKPHSPQAKENRL